MELNTLNTIISKHLILERRLLNQPFFLTTLLNGTF